MAALSRDPLRGERTRQAILNAAERLFLQHGFRATTMRQLAQAAGGIAVSGIYNHFSSKEDIFRCLLRTRAPSQHLMEILDKLEGDSGPDLIQQAFDSVQHMIFGNLSFFGLAMIDMLEFQGGTLRELIDASSPMSCVLLNACGARAGFVKMSIFRC